MFSKKIEISAQKSDYYSYTLSELKECFLTVPKNYPPYFNNIPKHIFDEHLNSNIHAQKTLKSCSGFLNLFRRSFVFTCPFDIHLLFDGDGNVTYSSVGISGDKSTLFYEVHPNFQFLNHVPNHNLQMVLKIRTRMFINSDTPLLIHKNFWSFNNIEVIPGIITDSYTDDLSFFIPIYKNQKELLINKGTMLFFITPLSVKKHSISYIIKDRNDKFKKTFSNLKKYIIKEPL